MGGCIFLFSMYFTVYTCPWSAFLGKSHFVIVWLQGWINFILLIQKKKERKSSWLVIDSSNDVILLFFFSGRVCPFTGKKSNRANKVSFSNHKTKKLQFVNLQYKRIWWEAGKRYVKLRLSTKALKTIEKNGLDAVAKKAGVDLRKK